MPARLSDKRTIVITGRYYPEGDTIWSWRIEDYRGRCVRTGGEGSEDREAELADARDKLALLDAIDLAKGRAVAVSYDFAVVPCEGGYRLIDTSVGNNWGQRPHVHPTTDEAIAHAFASHEFKEGRTSSVRWEPAQAAV